MSECLISRRGGETFKLPTLDPNYPEDITTMAALNGEVSFSVAILEHGDPEIYNYQWYINGVAVPGAINSNYTHSIAIGNTTTDAGILIYCEVKNKAGTVTSRAAKLIIKNPIITAGLDYQTIPDGVATLVKEDDYNWNLKVLSSCDLYIYNDLVVDVFVQGGGGGGGWDGDADFDYGGGGGAGGGQVTLYKETLTTNGIYNIIVGSGGAPEKSGNYSQWKNSTYRASGGGASTGQSGGTGGTANGGSGGGYWGNGQGGSGYDGGRGKQAFGVGTIFYGAGGGGNAGSFGPSDGNGGETGGGDPGENATPNTGSGGGGDGGSGGSGIVIIRNAR